MASSQWDRSCVSVDLCSLKPCWPSGSMLHFSRWSTRTLLITLSKTLTIWLVKATGLYWAGSALLPPLCTGQMSTRRRSGGISPWFNDSFHRIHSGFLNSLLHSFNNTAGIPSGPGAESELNSAHAYCMWSGQKSKSVRMGPVVLYLSTEKNCSRSGMSHSGLAWVNTELYWLSERFHQSFWE